MGYEHLYMDGPLKLKGLKHYKWDVFISAFNRSDRILKVYNKIIATNKIWVVQAEYGFKPNDIPTNQSRFEFDLNKTESENVISLFESGLIPDLTNKKLCIDCTGLMRPDLIYLVLFLYTQNIKKFDVIYTEPEKYVSGDETKFSQNSTGDVRSVDGCDLATERDTLKDLLIIGAGFDHDLISEIIEKKRYIKNKIQLLGFPSLKADMYQQNILRAHKSPDLRESQTIFAPANDPFVTASVLSETVKNVERDNGLITNLYLSPLSTKAQTLGFAIFYITECFNKRSASILIPVSKSYSEKTSDGVGRIWKYQIQLQ
jgi:hypothetical protein